jgi:hypothetical protein
MYPYAAFGNACSPWTCSIVVITSAMPKKRRAGVSLLTFDNRLKISVIR